MKTSEPQWHTTRIVFLNAIPPTNEMKWTCCCRGKTNETKFKFLFYSSRYIVRRLICISSSKQSVQRDDVRVTSCDDSLMLTTVVNKEWVSRVSFSVCGENRNCRTSPQGNNAMSRWRRDLYNRRTTGFSWKWIVRISRISWFLLGKLDNQVVVDQLAKFSNEI